MSEPERLLYRSNLLGSDLAPSPTSAGGNTSAKGRSAIRSAASTSKVLGSRAQAGDLGSMKLDGFATLYMGKLEQLKKLYRGPEHEDEWWATCRTAPSISTPARPATTPAARLRASQARRSHAPGRRDAIAAASQPGIRR